MSNRHYQVKLPTGTVVFFDTDGCPDSTEVQSQVYRQLVINGFYGAEDGTQPVDAELTELLLRNGQIVRVPCDSVRVMPPTRPLNAKEFREQVDACLLQLPPEFRSALCSEAIAYADNENYGASMFWLRDVCDKMVTAIQQYTNRIAPPKNAGAKEC